MKYARLALAFCVILGIGLTAAPAETVSSHAQFKEAVQRAVNEALAPYGGRLDLTGGTEHVERDEVTGEIRITRDPIRATVKLTIPQPEPPPPVGIPPAPAGFDIAALLAGASKTYWASVDGAGDGLTSAKPTTLAKLYSGGKLKGSVAVRLIADPSGRAHAWPFVASQTSAFGESRDKPLILAPADLNGPMPYVQKTDGITISGPAHVVLYGLRSTAIGVSNLRDIRVISCNFVGGVGNGINLVDLRPAAEQEGAEILGCLIAESGASGLYSNSAANVTVVGNVFDRCGTSSTKDHSLYLYNARGWRIADNWISRNSDTGIKIQTCDGVLVEGNTFFRGKSVGSPNANGQEAKRDRQCKNLVWRNNVASDVPTGFYSVGVNVDCEYTGNIWVRCKAIYQLIAPPDGPNDTPLTNVHIHHEKLWNSSLLAVLSDWHSDALAKDRFRAGVVFEANDVQGDADGSQRYVALSNGGALPTPDQVAMTLRGIEWRGNRIWREPSWTGGDGDKPYMTPIKRSWALSTDTSFMPFAEWVTLTGDTSTLTRVKWANPRGVPEVAAELGLTPDELIEKLRSREIDTTKVRDRIREGFAEVGN